jgi:hypothetical protein
MVAGIGLVIPASAAAECSIPGQISTGPDGWEQIQAPIFPEGGGTVTSFAVAPERSEIIYVSNGRLILRSADAGCTFKPVFQLSDHDNTNQASIVDIVIPPASTTGARIYALVAGLGGVIGPNLFASRDGGASWTESNNGLPEAGTPQVLAVAPSDPDVAYLLLEVAGLTDLIYVTRDGGASWALPTDTASTVTGLLGRVGFTFESIAVDAFDPARVWATTPAGLQRSDDGAETWEAVADVPADGLLDVYPLGGRSRILAFSSSTSVWVSDDGGTKWRTEATPARVDSATQGGGRVPLVLITIPGTSSNVYVSDFDLTLGWFPASSRTSPFAAVTADRVEPFPSYYALASGGLARSAKPSITDPPPPPPPLPAACENTPLPRNVQPPVVTRAPTTLTPERRHFVLSPGQSQRVMYRLDLPPTPSRLDGFFLVDTTGSMGGAICGLRHGLANIVYELTKKGIPVQLGVGDYKDYPIPPYGDVDDFPYRLHRAIGPIEPALIDALGQLQASGGGDGPESSLIGLYQAVTGVGQDIDPEGSSLGDTDPGQGAGFSADSLKVIVNVTDVAFHKQDEEPAYPGYTWDETSQVLQDAGVHQVGIAVGINGEEDLARMAEDTGTFAPAGGTDCNGDGVPDIYADQPLVCVVDPNAQSTIRIADPIVSILAAIEDRRTVSLSADRGADITTIKDPERPNIDVKDPHKFTFSVKYSCDSMHAGTTTPVTLNARVGREVVAEAVAIVDCLAPADPPQQPPIAPAVPPITGPPPARIPQNQPNPRLETRVNPQSQPNPQTQAQPQAGLVTQRQEQPQMAFVQASGKIQAQYGSDNAMVGVSHRDDPLVNARGILATSAMVLIVAWGTVSHVLNPARIRRR